MGATPLRDLCAQPADVGKTFAPEQPTSRPGEKNVAQSRDDRAGRGARRTLGQETGSKRPADRIGAAGVAPKKRTVEPKGTKRPGAGKKTRPGKGVARRKVKSKKPSTPRGR